ncbi:MAG: hypothetical protein QOF37_1398 [Thermoleophilaceae bacterium]|jgi:predicted lipoprotein with Yx(FWY)xxD motif|nr:hypothetical protein [Thermoleophilaceae bacterium]
MKRVFIPIALIAVAAVVAIVAAGGGSAKSGTNPSTASPPAGAAAAAIGTRTTALGTFVTDASGKTLYLFEADKPNVSNCSSACLSVWPAFVAGARAPHARGAAMAGRLGMTKPQNGKSIVTYNGHPLYYFAGDQKPGATTGQGLNQFGGGWYVVTPAGGKIDKG